MRLWYLSRKWIVRAYLVILPCLWWQGVSQPQAQAITWQVATVWLVCVVMRGTRPRLWQSGAVGALMAGLLASSLFHWPAQGYPMLILLALIGWATVWTLIHLSPDAAWIEQSLVWLALVNVGYSVSQQIGYDPLFETANTTGFMGRLNTLSVLWLVALPMAATGWQRAVLVGAILLVHNWTAMIGVGMLLAWWAWRLNPGKSMLGFYGLVLTGVVGWWVLHPGLWTMKALPRVLTWQETFGQALWSPIWGYGLGARSAMSRVGSTGDIGYNIWLEAFHAGGLLILAPLGWMVWRMWQSADSPARTALLLIAAAGCTQSLWNSTGLVIVTLALVAAWELRRMDAV